jgi:hypothetical protein
MPSIPKDQLAWLNDPTLDNAARWKAFKAWEAQKRLEYASSEEALEDHRAWTATQSRNSIGKFVPPGRRRRKVFRLS